MESHFAEVESASRASIRGKTDPEWEHVNERIEGNVKVFTCLCSGKEFRGRGITRMKKHLAGVRGEIAHCLKVSSDVCEDMLKAFSAFEHNKKELTAQNRTFIEMEGPPTLRGSYEQSTKIINHSAAGDSPLLEPIPPPNSTPSHLFTQRTLQSAFAGKDASLKVDRAIARWFYESTWKEIVRPGATRFATTFLSLSSIVDRKSDLQALMVDDFWKESPHSKTVIGKDVMVTVLDLQVWEDCIFMVKLTTPIVRLLRIVDSDTKPALGYVHEGMTRVEKVVKEICANVEARYMCYTNILDKDIYDPIDYASIGAASEWIVEGDGTSPPPDLDIDSLEQDLAGEEGELSADVNFGLGLGGASHEDTSTFGLP
ncbi:hypothetical protein LINPERPRIM_LOCUS38351 [Linum perenne]